MILSEGIGFAKEGIGFAKEGIGFAKEGWDLILNDGYGLGAACV